jgi:hypothetical protein
LRRYGGRAQRAGQVTAEPGHGRAEAGQGQAPEQHRALVAAPGSGHPVEQRLFGVGIGRDIGHREVGDHEGVHQGGESDGHAQEGGERRAFAGGR